MTAIQRFLGHTDGLAFHEPVVIVYERELKALEQRMEHFERFKAYLEIMGGLDMDAAWEATESMNPEDYEEEEQKVGD